ASTEESEENCAIMAAMQLMDFLENGNIKNSVNFPESYLDRSGNPRLTISNQNSPGMIEKITHLLAESKINIADMLNKSKGDIAYNIIEINGDINDGLIKKIGAIDGILAVRVL
nr:phosphoglycerate dehydrogenase [Deltaproteobacteria bacterium]